MLKNDIKYWNNYYKFKKYFLKNSNFAAFVKKEFINKKTNILEIGAGNGRDSFYLAKYSKYITAIDQCKIVIQSNTLKVKKLNIKNLNFIQSTVNEIKNIPKKNTINLIYARFFLHSISENKENLFLKSILHFNSFKPLIALEFRTTKDKLMSKGKKLSKYERYTDHYRRFINMKDFERKLAYLDFKIVYKKFGTNLSIMKNDNPHLCRILFQKK